MALWGRSHSLTVEVWEDLTAQASPHNALADPEIHAEWEQIEKLRAHTRWVDAAVIPCAAYLSLTGATLAIPWARLSTTEQIIFAIGLVGIWVISLWQSVTGGVSPKLLTAILLARRFRPGQHV